MIFERDIVLCILRLTRTVRDFFLEDIVVCSGFARSLIERVIVEVKADCYIDLSHVEQLNEYAMYLAGRNVRIMKKILVIPAGARISQPALDLIDEGDIEVVRLRSFTCGY